MASRSAVVASRSTPCERSSSRSSSTSPLWSSTLRANRSRRLARWRRCSTTRPSRRRPVRPSASIPSEPRSVAMGSPTSGIVAEVAALAQPLGVRAVTVDATAVHDAGASDVQELAYSLAAGVAYLRALVAAGAEVDAAAALIDFRYAATDEQFPTIAKLRAARRLWNRVAELSGVTTAAAGQAQHAVTSRPMMAKCDPYVNMLRTTVAAFSAGVGGAARQRDGAALRRAARSAGGVQPSHRPQHLESPDQRVARRRGRGPGRRSTRRREAHGRPRACGLGAVRRDRGQGWTRRVARLPPRGHCSDRLGPRARHRQAQAAHHRCLGVPQPARGAARAPPLRSRRRRAPVCR